MSPSHRNLDTTKGEEYDYIDEEFKNVILPKKIKNDFCPPVKYNI